MDGFVFRFARDLTIAGLADACGKSLNIIATDFVMIFPIVRSFRAPRC